MINVAFYPILGKPLILYLGALTLISFLITATIGLRYYRGLIKFKWHPTMVVISFILAITMGIIGFTAGSPTVGVLGLLTIFSFFITAMLGLSIHHRWLHIRFRWHPTMVVVSFILASIHAVIALLVFG